MRIALEIVPRNPEFLSTAIQEVKSRLRRVTTLTLPDLKDSKLSSLDASLFTRWHFPDVIPCFRALEIDLEKPWPEASLILEKGFKEIALVTGDPPKNSPASPKDEVLLEAIRKLKREISGLKIYVGLDPYRKAPDKEMEYARAKLEAGADGFITQAFFDLRLFETYSNLLKPHDVFWGVSPVLDEFAWNFWNDKIKAVFPSDFSPTPDWNRAFAKKMMDLVGERGGNLLFMPIRAPILDCYEGIL